MLSLSDCRRRRRCCCGGSSYDCFCYGGQLACDCLFVVVAVVMVAVNIGIVIVVDAPFSCVIMRCIRLVGMVVAGFVSVALFGSYHVCCCCCCCCCYCRCCYCYYIVVIVIVIVVLVNNHKRRFCGMRILRSLYDHN